MKGLIPVMAQKNFFRVGVTPRPVTCETFCPISSKFHGISSLMLCHMKDLIPVIVLKKEKCTANSDIWNKG